MTEQIILTADLEYSQLTKYIRENHIHKIFLVCDRSLALLKIGNYFKDMVKTNISLVYFSDFAPNPLYESVVSGIDLFQQEQCDCIIAVGGGSAIDVAKCIKLYSSMSNERCFLEQTIIPNDIKLLVIPTTAGTGSEATRFAVIYYEGSKQSISDCSCIPNCVLFDATVLKTLPIYQKKSTLLDAFCHAVESFWSINSTDESKMYSRKAIEIILTNMDRYLKGEEESNIAMLYAANLAGKAINITETTAGHAMCYKLTSLYGIAHGHSVAICIKKLWPYMVYNIDKCIDPRGKEYLSKILLEIAHIMGCTSAIEAAEKYVNILDKMELMVPESRGEDIVVLKSSVNMVRLKNNPVKLTEDVIVDLYRQILEREK